MDQITTPIYLSIVAIMGIVITVADIENALPIGTSREAAEMYLNDIGSESRFITRENDDPQKSPKFPWMDSEIGYLVTLVSGVRRNWWRPSLGTNYRVKVGISESGKVTQVNIYGASIGWP